MIEQALFGLGPAATPDLAATGGVPVAVDRAFSTVRRLEIDATSWVEHVPGWLSRDQALLELLMAEAHWEQRTTSGGTPGSG